MGTVLLTTQHTKIEVFIMKTPPPCCILLGIALVHTVSSATVEVITGKSGRHWKKIPVHSLVTEYQAQGGDVLDYRYSEGSETWDTWRYAKTRRLPLRTEFTDANNVQWRVTLHHRRDSVAFVVPISRELFFWGDERDRVAVDARCKLASLTFRYNPGGWTSSHGIRLKTRGLKHKSQGSHAAINDWAAAIDLAAKGVGMVTDIVNTGAKVYTARG